MPAKVPRYLGMYDKTSSCGDARPSVTYLSHARWLVIRRVNAFESTAPPEGY